MLFQVPADVGQQTVRVDQILPWCIALISVAFNALMAKSASDSKSELRKEIADSQDKIRAEFHQQQEKILSQITTQYSEVTRTFTLQMDLIRREFVPREGDIERRSSFEMRMTKAEEEIDLIRERYHAVNGEMNKLALQLAQQINEIATGPIQTLNGGLQEVNRRLGEMDARGRSQDDRQRATDDQLRDVEDRIEECERRRT